ncbi:unnamed protein product [Pedinophyceae sp. YPF-701]|nr:unnamed protein product [Pedinophyceae sp. YPF-701]
MPAQVAVHVRGTNGDAAADLASAVERTAGGAVVAAAATPSDFAMLDSFRADDFFAHLPGDCNLGQVLLTSPKIDSTQSLLQACSKLLPTGTAFVADTQDSGRGRGSNAWTTPRGCLAVSLLLRFGQDFGGLRASLVQHVACLAVVRALRAEAVARGCPEAARKFVIKWPNDLYADGVKIGGVLCQATGGGASGFTMVTGIGLNVLNNEPTTCVQEVIRRCIEASGDTLESPVSRESVLAGLLAELSPLLTQLAGPGGFESLRGEYTECWMHTGQEVALDPGVVVAMNGAAAPQEAMRATVHEVSSMGYLIAVDGHGRRYELVPDMNSLDPLSGVVRAKQTV